MIGHIAAAVGVLVLVSAAAVVAPRVKLAVPLVLVAAGIVLSLVLPAVPEIEPELILEVMLPPLLYASAVSMPAMNFRREFGAISGLSVLLVVATSLVLGLVFALLVPGLGFAWGVALGAIISPTDAVATSIIKGGGVPGRVLVLLDGESLLNDASALVILRTAIVAAASGFAFWPVVGSFAYAVIVAVVIGLVVGRGNLEIRRRVKDPTVNTLLSFTVAYLASVPAEALGASGLVAAVVAGLVTGVLGPRLLPPRHRHSDAENWSSVQLVLEGMVFLGLGLQLSSVLHEVEADQFGVGPAVGLAALALLIVVAVRAAYVVPLLWALRRAAARGERIKPRIVEMGQRLEAGGTEIPYRTIGRQRPADAGSLARASTRLRRLLADVDYLLREPLGPREGAIVVWAGMRGAVTVAAAQTLPASTPARPLLVFVAFAVALLSLVLQGGTIGALVARLFPTRERPASEAADHAAVLTLLREAAAGVPAGEESRKEHELAEFEAQRVALLDARDDGLLDAEMLGLALEAIDTAQIALEARGGPQG